MSVQTYCVQADVEAILSSAGVVAFANDSEDGTLDATETGYIATAIEHAATRMNAILEVRYVLAELASNAWCKYCNAVLAAWMLTKRRGNSPPPALDADANAMLDTLADIRNNQQTIPQQPESFDHLPAVSNFGVVRGLRGSPVRVDTQKSTGDAPHPSRKRNAGGWPYYW